MEENQNKRTGIPYSWIGRCNLVNTSVFPRSIYRFTVVLVGTPDGSIVDIGKLILIPLWQLDRPKNSRNDFEMEESWRTVTWGRRDRLHRYGDQSSALSAGQTAEGGGTLRSEDRLTGTVGDGRGRHHRHEQHSRPTSRRITVDTKSPVPLQGVGREGVSGRDRALVLRALVLTWAHSFIRPRPTAR